MSSIPNSNPSIPIPSEESELASEQLKMLMKKEQNRGKPKVRHTPEQKKILMEAFKEDQNPSEATLASLATQTNLKLKQVKVWYFKML